MKKLKDSQYNLEPSNDSNTKTALITGGGTGLGLEIARQLLVHGYRVIIIGRRRVVINRALKELRQESKDLQTKLAKQNSRVDASSSQKQDIQNVYGYSADVSDISKMTTLFKGWHKKGIAIDVLINNAGIISPIAHVGESEPADWLYALQVNTFGVYLPTRLALPTMIKRKGGVIVNISSGAAHHFLEGWSAYCASKAGASLFTQAIHEEYYTKGIRVFGYRPGMVDTPMQEEVRKSKMNPVSKVPREDLLSPSECARAVVWLVHSLPQQHKQYLGNEVDIRDPEFRERIGLRSY